MARPSGMKRNPKHVLLSLGRTADYPYAIVDWSTKEVYTYIEDRNEGLDQVRELNGVSLKPVRKHRTKQQYSVRAELHAKA